MSDLLDYLSATPPGPILDTAELESLLAASWGRFAGGRAEDMAGYKLLHRMENVFWNPPILTFEIERHGRTALGSTRADRHQWTLDLRRWTAEPRRVGYRQVHSMEPRLNVRPLAEEIAGLIRSGQEDRRLKWNKDGTARVLIGEILPPNSAFKQTLAGRRRRFREALDQTLKESGWRQVKLNVYAPPSPAGGTVPPAANPPDGA